MKKQKQILGMVLAVCLMLTSYIPVKATETSEKNIQEKSGRNLSEEISFIQQSDYKYDVETGAYYFKKKSINKEMQKTVFAEKTGKKEEILVLIPYTVEAKENLPKIIKDVKIMRASGGSNTKYGTDSAGCVSATLTVSYDSYTKNGKEYAFLKNVSGGFTGAGSGNIIASGVSVVGNNVTYGQSGINTSGLFKSQSKTYNIGNSSRSFSVSPPSNWVAVASESQVAKVGATYTITLKRGTGNWNCTIVNNLSF